MWLKLKPHQLVGLAVIGIGVWWHETALVVAGLGAMAAPINVGKDKGE